MNLRYSALTAAVLAGMFMTSSVPFLTTERSAVVRAVANLSHAPLFAGLAFLWFKTFAPPRGASPGVYMLAFVATAVCAVADEWHQSFVPGRVASGADLAIDVTAAAAMLGFLRVRQRAPAGAPGVEREV